MKKHGFQIFWLLLPVAAIVALDEWIKFWALKQLPDEGSLVDPGILSFAIHKNFGIAFNIPFKMPIIILISIVIGVFLLRVIQKNVEQHPDIAMSSLTIIIGAIGNLYDRIVYGFTVDYLILFARLAINFSDIVIVAGVIWLLMASRRTKSHKFVHPDEPTR